MAVEFGCDSPWSAASGGIQGLFCFIDPGRAICQNRGSGSCTVHAPDAPEAPQKNRNVALANYLRFRRDNGIGVAFRTVKRVTKSQTEQSMNLAVWLPGLLILGLAGLGLMCAFIMGCEKV